MTDHQQQAEDTIKRCIQLIKKDWSNRGQEYFTQELYREAINQPYLFREIPENVWQQELNRQISLMFPPAQMMLGIGVEVK